MISATRTQVRHQLVLLDADDTRVFQTPSDHARRDAFAIARERVRARGDTMLYHTCMTVFDVQTSPNALLFLLST